METTFKGIDFNVSDRETCKHGIVIVNVTNIIFNCSKQQLLGGLHSSL